MALMVGFAVSDIASDQRECFSKLYQLIPCISYVQGFDKSPTEACCNNLVQLYSASPKCLCLLMINESNAVGNGININHTLALHMPEACQMEANISTCPGLLHISPYSPEVKGFKLNTTSASAPQVAVGFSSSPTDSPPITSSSGFQVKTEETLAIFIMAFLLNNFINAIIEFPSVL
ncbi:hypothetical protein SUGI_0364710 [Cryptomeria japonica]|nr:hypothetical protein SUGI_0364710 [Cryptomeria japonica]